METIIKLSPSELNEMLLDKIRRFIGEKEDVDITISFKETNKSYAEALSRSIQQAEDNDIISFSLEDFMEYKPL